MRILVTGSSGLIGTKVCEKLESNGHYVRRFDITPPSNLPEDFVSEDLLDSNARANVIKGIDGVIHLAAVSRVIDAEIDPDRCIDVNSNGTQALVNDLIDSNKNPWFIYGSSREVYGNPEKIPADEELEVNPVNVYGETKVAAENSVRGYNRVTGATSTIFRFSNVYGSVDDHETRVIPAFVRSALTGSSIRMDGSDHTFDFTHVEDTANAVVEAVNMIGNNELSGCHTLNVCTERGTNLIELVNIIVSRTGTNPTIIQGKPRKYDVPYFIGSSSKLFQVLGVSCNMSLEEGISSLVEDFRKHLGNNAVEHISQNMINDRSATCATEEATN